MQDGVSQYVYQNFKVILNRYIEGSFGIFSQEWQNNVMQNIVMAVYIVTDHLI